MKKEIADLWANALENGEYQQGTAHLKFSNKFCCLGVLCDLYRQKSRRGKWADWDELTGFKLKDETQYELLPSTVVKWAGMFSSRGEFKFPIKLKTTRPRGLEPLSLAILNDVEEKTFKQIAKLIRQHWENL